MNHRQPPHLPVGVRRALRCLSLLLVPALSLQPGNAGQRTRLPDGAGAEQIPYLPVLGPSSLRIEEAPPPPDLVTRPPAAAPPVPALTPAESSVAAANADAARSAAAAVDTAAEEGKPSATVVPPAPAAKAPAPILPDSSRPTVHPEDFLPYFQIPGSARQPGDVNIVIPGAPSAPTPAPIPPSSATYTQTPR